MSNSFECIYVPVEILCGWHMNGLLGDDEWLCICTPLHCQNLFQTLFFVFEKFLVWFGLWSFTPDFKRVDRKRVKKLNDEVVLEKQRDEFYF